ncbi:site-specific integrase [Gracilimonas tropica]|uniref:site-specific integrase n=1 Tax=Gracilimonas tropica TaxID=454600 RepID=UPI00035C91B2|nr:site-specific integrase [Gracilimonas tropica]
MGIKIREKDLKSGKKSLYLDIYHKGKRNYEFLKIGHLTGDKNKDEEIRDKAKAIKAKRELQIFNETYDFDKKDDDLLFTDFMQIIADEFEKKGNRNVSTVLFHVREFGKDDISFRGVDEKWIKGFKDYLLDEVKQSTARTYFLVLQSVINKAVKKGHLKKNPMDEVENIPKDEPKIEYLNDEELNKLWGTDISNIEVKRAFLFSCYTGLRLSDVQRLKWSDIEDVRDNGKAYKQISINMKKTNDLIYIPISKRAEKLLNVKHRVSEYVFDISPSKVEYWLPKWAKKAELGKHIHFHMSRHTFATRLLNKGVNIFTVSKLLGHASIEHTQKYLHLRDTDKKSAIDVLD